MRLSLLILSPFEFVVLASELRCLPCDSFASVEISCRFSILYLFLSSVLSPPSCYSIPLLVCAHSFWLLLPHFR